MRRKPETRRAWLENPGAAQRVADLVGCSVEQVADARVEQDGPAVPAVLTVTVVRRISPRDARVLLQGVSV